MGKMSWFGSQVCRVGLVVICLPTLACGRIGYDLGRDGRDGGNVDMATGVDAQSSDANRDVARDISGDVLLDVAQDSGFDVGPDMAVSSGTTTIYRSVGPGNITALAIGGSNGLTISGTTASFGMPLPDRVGVGDALQYDSTGDGSIDAIAFIHERVSSTTYVVATVAGETPQATASDQDWSIFRAYTALGASVLGTENTGIDATVRDFDTWSGSKDLVGSDEQWNIACYNDAPDTARVLMDGWTTGPSNYVRIFTPYTNSQVGTSQRHAGSWGSGGYALEFTGEYHFLETHVSYTVIEGLRVRATSFNADFAYGIRVTGAGVTGVHIRNNIVKEGTGVGGDRGGIIVQSTTTKPSYIYNNIVHGFSGTQAFGIFAGSDFSGRSSLVLSNTVANCNGGIVANWGDVQASNNLVYQTTEAFLGHFVSGSDNNATDNSENTSGDLNTSMNDRPNQTFVFVNAIGEDFHLHSTDTGATDFGADLSTHPDLPIVDDIDSETRTIPWDIGADAH